MKVGAKKLGNGKFKGIAYTRMSCGHELTETHENSDERKAKQGAEDLLRTKIKGHAKTCERMKGK